MLQRKLTTKRHQIGIILALHIAELCCCPVGCQCDRSKFLDATHHNIVQSLHAAAKEHCPVTTDSFYKSYWDEEMSELKHRSIDTHVLWVACGRPRCGPIYRDLSLIHI